MRDPFCCNTLARSLDSCSRPTDVPMHSFETTHKNSAFSSDPQLYWVPIFISCSKRHPSDIVDTIYAEYYISYKKNCANKCLRNIPESIRSLDTAELDRHASCRTQVSVILLQHEIKTYVRHICNFIPDLSMLCFPLVIQLNVLHCRIPPLPIHLLQTNHRRAQAFHVANSSALVQNIWDLDQLDMLQFRPGN